MRTIKTNNDKVVLNVEENTSYKQLDEEKLDQIKPSGLAAACKLAAKNGQAWVTVINKVPGQSTVTEPSIAVLSVGDSVLHVKRTAQGQFEFCASKIVRADVYVNGSISNSHVAVNNNGDWQVVHR